MQLEVNDEELRVLRQLVEEKLAELSVEIRHTDTPSFRDEVKQRRETLRRVDEVLRQSGGSASE